jgi:hypothetical protein
MKAWPAFLILLPLSAQETAPAAKESASTIQEAAPAAAEAKPAAQERKPAAQETGPAAPEAAASAATPEPGLTGSVDVGYRWRTGVAGSLDTYRSVVNLGEGPKLFGLDLSFQSATRRWFDRIGVRANNWGGDPYNTAHVDASRHGWYNFNFDYRNIAYYNFLPSFADPTIGQGFFLDQRSYDSRRRMSDFELELLPGRRIVPYLAYSHDAGSGRGITDFVSDVNEYPVADRLRDKTDNFRGGVRIEMSRFHVTLEQGGSTFKDDQQVFTSEENFGNRTTTFLGEQLFLTNLTQAYGVRGTSIYSKALVTANPASWIDLFGQFLYSRPDTNVNYAQYNAGQFYNLDAMLFFTSELDLLNATAKLPHTSGTFGFELRPMRRVRVIESISTDRLHDASSASLTQNAITPPVAPQIADFTDRLVWNYNQQQIDVLCDLTSKITARGGYRYVWGDGLTRGSFISGLPTESGQVRRQVGLAGLNYRMGRGISLNIDYEGASGDRAYFRTSLQDYQKARVRVRYQPVTSLTIAAGFGVLSNQNPAPTVKYDFLSRDSSVSVLWNPNGGKRISLAADYTRSTLRSDINYYVPQTFDKDRSLYRDNAHEANALMDLLVPGFGGHGPRLGLGGSLFRSSGNRPAQYYQPLIRLTTPAYRRMSWYGEWRYYGFAEPFYMYEGFRTHLLAIGVRYTP